MIPSSKSPYRPAIDSVSRRTVCPAEYAQRRECPATALIHNNACLLRPSDKQKTPFLPHRANATEARSATHLSPGNPLVARKTPPRRVPVDKPKPSRNIAIFHSTPDDCTSPAAPNKTGLFLKLTLLALRFPAAETHASRKTVTNLSTSAKVL